jgi:hypothetical protein
MPVDLDGVPPERGHPAGVGVEVPAMHGLAGLPQAVDVHDGRHVVQTVEAGGLEGLPHRALGHLRIAAQAPDPVWQAIQVAAGVGHPHADRQALAQGPGGNVDPGQDRCRMALHPAAEVPEGEHLLVRDGAGGPVHRVQQGRGVALAEYQVVVTRVVRLVEVVAQVLRHEHGHQVGGRHRGGGVSGACRRARSDRVDPELLPELTPQFVVVHVTCQIPQVPCRGWVA